MKNRERRGELVEVSLVFRDTEANCRQLSTRLLAIPAEHAAQVCRLKTVLEVQGYLYDLIWSALQELSDSYAEQAKGMGQELGDVEGEVHSTSKLKKVGQR